MNKKQLKILVDELTKNNNLYKNELADLITFAGKRTQEINTLKEEIFYLKERCDDKEESLTSLNNKMNILKQIIKEI